jgi:squalene-hopene/tetraprenyl-beta-curcumene cyclase
MHQIELNRPEPAPAPQGLEGLERAVSLAAEALLQLRRDDGHWVFELEADATIPAEYILLGHYLGDPDPPLERRMAAYLRRIQGEHGGWPLFHGGAVDLSASVKAYFALKAAGDSPDAPHMWRAREAILAAGGAARANVFTRILLALFGEVPWRAVPVMPVEIMNLPRWFPFHLEKVSYWTRTVLVPLLVVMAKRPRARNPNGVRIAELFLEPAERVRDWHPAADRTFWGTFFRGVDRVLHLVEPWFPAKGRQKAIDRAVAWTIERLNGEDGLGAIYPAIANSVMMFDVLGVPKDDPHHATARAALNKLLVMDEEEGRTYCQPCVSPIWDTALACHALLEAGGARAEAAVADGLDWLAERQVLDIVGDWAARRPGLRPGGWPFQYANAHYPDLDDTAVVVMALDRAGRERYRETIARATEWVVGMQSRNGGWAAFDADNESYYLNHIPFADHGALLDPPTDDVTARCLGMMGQLGHGKEHPAIAAGIDYLRRTQEADGSWFGRWGTNYIYGTWSVLCGLNGVGIPPEAPEIRRAVQFLLSCQRQDGGWGEDGASYWPGQPHGRAKESTASQTAWAVLGLIAAGEVDNPAVARGIEFLTRTQRPHGLWDEEWYTAVGFPRVFYLRYHGYRAFFPLWALARYRNLKHAGTRAVPYGM